MLSKKAIEVILFLKQFKFGVSKQAITKEICFDRKSMANSTLDGILYSLIDRNIIESPQRGVFKYISPNR